MNSVNSSMFYEPWWPNLIDIYRILYQATEKAMATHSSTLGRKITWTEEEPGGLPSMGSHRVRHDWSDLAAVIIADILKRVTHIAIM